MIGLYIGIGIAGVVVSIVVSYVTTKKEVHEKWINTNLWDTEEEDLNRLFNEIWSDIHGVDN